MLGTLALAAAAAAFAPPGVAQVLAPGVGDSAGAPPPARGAWRVWGRATLRFLGLAVYDATLAAPPDFAPERWATQPLALTLLYHRALRGEAIAERSLQEMRRGGPIDEDTAQRWLAFMKAAFPDVRPGDRITGRWWPAAGTASFEVNGAGPRELVDPAFGPRFFGIWLAPTTAEPGLRAQLLGQS